MEFRIKNLTIKIEFSFFFIICISLISGYKNTGMLILFCAVHEVAHLAALIALGGKAERLTISFFGIALKYNSDLPIKKEFFVICAGPLINLILYFFYKDDINLFLAVLNLLPVYPLDGGRIIKLLFPNAVRYISLAFLGLMFVFSVYLLIYHSVFSLLLVCLYLIVFNMRSL